MSSESSKSEYSLRGFFTNENVNKYYIEKLFNKVPELINLYGSIDAKMRDIPFFPQILGYFPTEHNSELTAINRTNWEESSCSAQETFPNTKKSPYISIKNNSTATLKYFNIPANSLLYYPTIKNLKSCYPECSEKGNLFYNNFDQAALKAQFDMTQEAIESYGELYVSGKSMSYYPIVYEYITKKDMKLLIWDSDFVKYLSEIADYTFVFGRDNNILVGTLCQWLKDTGRVHDIDGIVYKHELLSSISVYVCTRDKSLSSTSLPNSDEYDDLMDTSYRKCDTSIVDLLVYNKSYLYVFRNIVFNNEKYTMDSNNQFGSTIKQSEFKKIKDRIIARLIPNDLYKNTSIYKILFNSPTIFSSNQDPLFYRETLESYLRGVTEDNIKNISNNISDLVMASVTNFLRTEIYEMIFKVNNMLNNCATIIVAGAEAINLSLPSDQRAISTDIDTKVVPIFPLNYNTYKDYIVYFSRFRRYFWDYVLENIITEWNFRYIKYLYNLLLELENTTPMRMVGLKFINPYSSSFSQPFTKRYTILPKTSTIIQDIHLFSIDFNIKELFLPTFITDSEEDESKQIYVPQLTIFDWNLPILDMPLITPNTVNNTLAQYNYTFYNFDWGTPPGIFPIDTSTVNAMIKRAEYQDMNDRDKALLTASSSNPFIYSPINPAILAEQFAKMLSSVIKFVDKTYSLHDIEFLIESGTRPHKREKDLARIEKMRKYGNMSYPEYEINRDKFQPGVGRMKPDEVSSDVIPNEVSIPPNYISEAMNMEQCNKNNLPVFNEQGVCCSFEDYDIDTTSFERLVTYFTSSTDKDMFIKQYINPFILGEKSKISLGSIAKTLYILSPQRVVGIVDKKLERKLYTDIPFSLKFRQVITKAHNVLSIDTINIAGDIYYSVDNSLASSILGVNDTTNLGWKYHKCWNPVSGFYTPICDFLSSKDNLRRINLELLKDNDAYEWGYLYLIEIVSDLKSIYEIYVEAMELADSNPSLSYSKLVSARYLLSDYLLGCNLSPDDKQFSLLFSSTMVEVILAYSISLVKFKTPKEGFSKIEHETRVGLVDDFYYYMTGIVATEYQIFDLFEEKEIDVSIVPIVPGEIKKALDVKNKLILQEKTGRAKSSRSSKSSKSSKSSSSRSSSSSSSSRSSRSSSSNSSKTSSTKNGKDELE